MSVTGVIFGGPSPEHDISILSGLQAARELTSAGHDVVGLYWTKSGDWAEVSATSEGKDFLSGLPSGATPLQLVASPGAGFVSAKRGLFAKTVPLDVDVAVVCCHGGPGEDGSLQGALDLAGIRYTGPDVANAALGMDKLAFANVMRAAGLPVLDRIVLTDTTDDVGFGGPYIVKPRFGGSSIGIEVVDSMNTAKALLRTSSHLRAGAVIERYLPESFDLNVGARSFPSIEVSVIERPLRSAGSSILNYAEKYIGGEGMVSAPREIPANLGSERSDYIRSLALRVAQVSGLRGLQRIDFLVDGDGIDDIYVNEVNTIPGSLGKYLWIDPMIPFATLLDDMIREASERPSARWTTAGADGSALRSAGAIAGKLA